MSCVSKVVTKADANSLPTVEAGLLYPQAAGSMFLHFNLGGLIMAIKVTLGHFQGFFKTKVVWLRG